MIKDSTTARATSTAMRDLLRYLERRTIIPPARPTAPPLAPLGAASAGAELGGPARPLTAEPAPVRVGDWTLTQDPLSGDLVATHVDGTTTTVATKGTN